MMSLLPGASDEVTNSAAPGKAGKSNEGALGGQEGGAGPGVWAWDVMALWERESEPKKPVACLYVQGSPILRLLADIVKKQGLLGNSERRHSVSKKIYIVDSALEGKVE